MSFFIKQPGVIQMIYSVRVPSWTVFGYIVSFAGCTDITVKNNLTVYSNRDMITHSTYLFHIPCTVRSELHPFGRNDSIDRPMLLVFMQTFLDGGVMVEYLNFHTVIGSVHAHRGAYTDTVVYTLAIEAELKT